MRYHLYLLLIAVFIIECATTAEMKSPRGSRYVITADEIRESSAMSAYDAIRQLRPGLLDRDQRRAIDLHSVSQVVVYVQGVRYGEKGSLKTISALGIAEIKYLTPSEATTRFGSDHSGGAFLIKFK